MKYDFNRIPDWKGAHSVKWGRRKSFFGKEDVLPLWIADLDFETARPIAESLEERASHPDYGYTGRPPAFYEAIVNWMRQQHDWPIKKQWIKATPRISPALSLAVRAFSHPGEKVIVQPPVYHPFYEIIETNGRQLVFNHLKLEEGCYQMDFDALASQLQDPSASIFLLCHPHNPVGRVWTRKELTKLGNLCIKHDVLVIADEIHADVVYEGYKHTPFASISDEFAQNSVTCNSPSKTFNLSGLNIGYVIIPDERKRKRFYQMVQKSGLHMLNLFGIEALIAAYTQGREWYEQLIDYLGKNREFLLHFVKENLPGVQLHPPEGTFLGWLNFKKLGLEPTDLREFLVQKAGVGLVDGRKFNPGGDGFQRLNFGCPRKLLKKALRNIKKAVENLNT